MENVYGIGPPRSGTVMLARCLSVVKETHHECGGSEQGVRQEWVDIYRRSWLEGDYIDVSDFPTHPSEVAFFYTFCADQLDGKIIHIWRPIEPWVRSASGYGLMKEYKRMWVGEGSELPTGTEIESLITAWIQHHRFLLDKRPDAYVIRPDAIIWEDLLEWLGWGIQEDKVKKMNEIQNARPNRFAVSKAARSYPMDLKIPMTTELVSLETELESKTRR